MNFDILSHKLTPTMILSRTYCETITNNIAEQRQKERKLELRTEITGKKIKMKRKKKRKVDKTFNNYNHRSNISVFYMKNKKTSENCSDNLRNLHPKLKFFAFLICVSVLASQICLICESMQQLDPNYISAAGKFS